MTPGLELRVTQLQPLDLLARPVPFLAQLLVLLAQCLDGSGLGVGALPPSLLRFDDGARSLAPRRLVSVALSVPSITSPCGSPPQKRIVTQIEPNQVFSFEVEMSNLEGRVSAELGLHRHGAGSSLSARERAGAARKIENW